MFDQHVSVVMLAECFTWRAHAKVVALQASVVNGAIDKLAAFIAVDVSSWLIPRPSSATVVVQHHCR